MSVTRTFLSSAIILLQLVVSINSQQFPECIIGFSYDPMKQKCVQDTGNTKNLYYLICNPIETCVLNINNDFVTVPRQ